MATHGERDDLASVPAPSALLAAAVPAATDGRLARQQVEPAETAGSRGRDARPPLPAGVGRDLVIATCVQCHDLAVTMAQRKTLAEWRQSVDAMVRLGAKLNGSEIQTVARYLAKGFAR